MYFWLVSFLFFSALFSDDRLFLDLLLTEYLNEKVEDRLPVYFNHLNYGGYFNMPSARMGDEGEIGFGYASLPPYRIWSLRSQLTPNIEVTLNYRIFKGIPDPILTPHGFGDLSDKGANVKLALFRPEDSDWRLPGLAFGWEDFMGTRNFKSVYFAATKVFRDEDCEITLGYGWQRIRGLFGGLLWIPFRKWKESYLSGWAIAAEYDATPYKDENVEKHPRGRKQKTPFNFGLKYKLGDHFDFSLSYIRGCKWAASGSVSYNFGYTKGLLPKIDDPLPYCSPRLLEPFGPCRPEEKLALELIDPFFEQGFDLLDVALSYDEKLQPRLHLTVFNNSYRTQEAFRGRLASLLANLIPSNIGSVIVTLNSEGFPVQEYRYEMPFVRSYGECQMSLYQLNVLSPEREVTFVEPLEKKSLLARSMPLYNFYLEPRTYTLFGSAKGKFKYSLGLNAGVDGFLPYNIYYSILLGSAFFGDIDDVRDSDLLNPSQLINVRTDIVNYYKGHHLSLDEAYLQKNWALGNGFYSKLALGYFEIEYAGIANEWLWYPLKYPFALSVEGAIFKKRKTHGLGFESKIRKLDGFIPTYRKFTGSQYFLNLYWRWYQTELDFKISAGKFLANDYGVRFQVSRYFPSGLNIYFWYTLTNGHDHVNGHLYYDKGIGFTMPLDIFYTYSDRERWGYGMSAWLRDVGVQARVGLDLYELISQERQ